MVGLTALLGLLRAGAQEGGTQEQESGAVPVWRRCDIVLHSKTEYENPYADVEIDAVFTHEDGDEIRLYGFWNGGDEWRVRFAPTKVGRWDYTVSCSDEGNEGLHGVKGSVLAVENEGTTELDKHGFVRVSENGRYFVYDDGTPFFWLGDTNWQAPNYVSITRCNYPGCSCSNQFRHEVDDRLKKGFTVYQTYFDSAESDGGGQRGVNPEPSMWKKRHTEIDPAVFTEKYDRMFDYLADHGMVIALGFGVHSSTVSSMSGEALDWVSRYLTARYASYPVIWITAQEITGDEQYDAWVRSAEITEAGDGYGHPQSAHMYPMGADNRFAAALNRCDWHDFFTLQNGHGPLIPQKGTYRGYWELNGKNGGPKPFVESEANYEDIYCGGFNGYEASRITAWKAVLCGSCGFTYGVTGIWANCYSTAGDTGWLGTFSAEPWYMGLDKPGSYEVGYMAAFFRAVGFETLVPRFSDTKYSDFRDERAVLASSDDASTAVAYFYNDGRSTGTLRALDPEALYRAFWFDPLSGKYIPAGEDIRAEAGRYAVPEKPSRGDWVFLLTARPDFSPEKTEPMPPAPAGSAESESSVNLLRGAAAKASSFSARGSEPKAATDGKENSWWCASDGSFPQWISFDMGEEKSFNSLSLRMYPGTASAVWTVEISPDGDEWTTVREEERVPVDPGNGTIGGFLGETFAARYIRVTFHEVVGNWAAVVEAEAALKEGAQEKELPAYGGKLQTPAVFCTGSAVYSASGVLKNSTDALTDRDLSTVWSPFAPEATQTILCDLGDLKSLTGMNLVLGAGSFVPHIRVEGSRSGSEDGEDWDILADTKTGGLNLCRAGDRAALTEALSGEYRRVKLLVFGAPGKNSVKTIAALELYAEEQGTDGAPASGIPAPGEADGILQAPEDGETTPPPEHAEPIGQGEEAAHTDANGKSPVWKTVLPILAGALVAAASFILLRRRRK